MRIEAVTELRKMARDIRDFARGAENAFVIALTRTARDVRDAEQREIRDVFDRPTQFTQRAPTFTLATRQKPEAVVKLKDDGRGGRAPATYLSAQIEGGRRRFKAFEEALRKAGAMPPFTFAVPGKFARLDAFGNISRGQITQILSQLRTGTSAGFSRNLPYPGERKYADQNARALKTIRAAYRRAGGQYFAVPYRRGRLEPGIYIRASRSKSGGPQPRPRPVIRFVDAVHYDERFDFFYVAELTAARRYEANLDAALAEKVGSSSITGA